MHEPTNAPPELNWDDLRYFLAAFDAGSMSAGARALGVEQSTISRRMKRLESALGTVLFERHPDGLRPTEHARALFERAQAVGHHVDALQRAAARLGTGGVVRLATTETMSELLLVPGMPALLRSHPDVRLELNLGLPLVDLLGGQADIAVRNVRPTDDRLVSRKLASLQFAPFAHRDYWATHRTRALPELDWITVADPEGIQLPEQRWFEEHVGVTPRISTSTFKAQLEAVGRGLGVGLITRVVAAASPELEEIDVDVAPLPGFDLWLVVHRERRGQPHVRAVIDWLVELCSTLDATDGSKDRL